MRDLIWKLGVLWRMVREVSRETWCDVRHALSQAMHHSWIHWRREVWPKDPDSLLCCSGYECGCMGVTVREAYAPRPAEPLCGKRIPGGFEDEFCCRPHGHPGECDSIPF